jgi:hypothetical protein
MNALFTIFLIFLSQDTIEVKGTNGMAYRVFAEQRKLCFQYKLGRNWSEPMILDTGDVSEPSIALTPDDYLHLAYCKNRRVCYRTTLEPITKESIKNKKKPHWSTWVFVSPYFTEPASNISIRTEGDYLYVIWQSPAKNNPKVTETWKRIKLISNPLYRWFAPECLSKSSLRRQLK